MGVMACSRHGCGNVMCDRLICDGAYYICDECLVELKTYQATWKDRELTVLDVYDRVSLFMGSCPGQYKVLYSQEIGTEFNRLIGE